MCIGMRTAEGLSDAKPKNEGCGVKFRSLFHGKCAVSPILRDLFFEYKYKAFSLHPLKYKALPDGNCAFVPRQGRKTVENW